SGQIVIETYNCVLDEHFCQLNPGAVPGKYVELAICDSGDGIDPAIIDRLFDPFFTTKAEGKGTGLGLAMVYGFVNRSAGFIKVCSQLGKGTTFKVYLPKSQRINTTVALVTHQVMDASGGDETLLLVDDEPELLALANETLSQLGYNIITAYNGKEALECLAADRQIRLMFSDIIMPGSLNGYQLAEQALAIRPNLQILLTSGFTAKAVPVKNGQSYTVELLKKPYSQAEMALQIRMLLALERQNA
ncbi:MAG: response regulator, partial [Algicola sp.]|nr:response regulator [Algicola sp.]